MVQWVKNLNDYFVYWEFDKKSSSGGTIVKDPIEIRGREDTEVVEYKNTSGTETLDVSNIIVDRQLKEKSYIWQGMLADLTPGQDPQRLDDAKIIEKYGEYNSPNGFVTISKIRVGKK